MRHRGPLSLFALVLITGIPPMESSGRASPALISRGLEEVREISRGPRRPLPVGDHEFTILGTDTRVAREGTAFALDFKGRWATAAHVTEDCRYVRLVANGRVSEPVRFQRGRQYDVTLIVRGLLAPRSLEIADEKPKVGSIGYHMGFPMGVASIVGWILIGAGDR